MRTFMPIVFLLAFVGSGRGAETVAIPADAYRPVATCEDFLESVGLGAAPFDGHHDTGPYAGAGTYYPPEFFFDLGVRYYRCGFLSALVNPDQPRLVREWRVKTGARPMPLMDPTWLWTLKSDWRNAPADGDFTRFLGEVKRYAPGDIAMIEAPNELNNKFPPQELNLKYKGLVDEAAGAAYQRDLYAALKSDPATANIPLINFTAIFSDYRLAKPCDAFDFNNMHSYQGDDVPSSSLMMNVTRANNILPAGAATRPFIPTESGYNVETDVTNQQNYQGTLRGQAYNIPMLLAEYFRNGVYRTMLFALHNADGYGLLESDQKIRRPSWYALKSFLALFKDAEWNGRELAWEYPRGARPVTLRALPFTLRDAPATVHTIVLQHSSGDHFILIWNELRNLQNKRDIKNPEINVTLAFPKDSAVRPVGHWRQGELPDNVYASEEATRAAEFKPAAVPPINGSNEMRVAVPSRVVVLRVRGLVKAYKAPAAPKVSGDATENRVAVTVSGIGGTALLYRDDCFLAALPLVNGRATFTDDTEWIRPGIGYRYAAQLVFPDGMLSAKTETVIAAAEKYPDFVLSTFGMDGIALNREIAVGTPVTFTGKIKNAGDGASPSSKRMPGQPPQMYDVSVALTVTVDGKDAMWGSGGADAPYAPGEERGVAVSGGHNRGVWVATPGLHVVRAEIDDLRRVFSEKTHWNNVEEFTVQVGPTGGGKIFMRSTAAPGSVDLTADGASDWLHPAGWQDKGQVVRKAKPADAARRITLPESVGKGHTDLTLGGPIQQTWSDGDAVPENRGGTHTGLWGNNVGNGVGFTVPADTTPRRLRVYCGLLEGASGKFTAKLSDGSAPEVVSTGWSANLNGQGFLWAAQPASGSVMYEVVYQAAKDGETLAVTWSLNSEPNRFRGQWRLGAVTLSPAP
ncbi:MAG: hypothetical protein LBW77_01175 [Verrucomicrobiota bacterium]|jgi:hypothetical protein|nr:hypothetical protein [Verrucomicrobiota bacterium]